MKLADVTTFLEEDSSAKSIQDNLTEDLLTPKAMGGVESTPPLWFFLSAA